MSSSFLPRVLAVLSVVALAVGTVQMTAVAQVPNGRWVRLAPYPQPTQEIGAAIVGGKLYVLGAYGANAPGGLAGWFNEYDPATDRGRRQIELIAQVFNVSGSDNLIASGGLDTAGGVSASWSTNALADSFGRIPQASNRQQAELGVRFTW